MDNNMQPIVVSVICNTFNHEKYIAQALESFINQETSFAFEVLVHDDASTDRTAKIVRKYEECYPGILKPLYQKENQYSKGRSVTAEFQIPRAQGKYIAFCEGDDYWISNDKLQKQVEFMEQHPEASWCVCNGINVTREGRKISDYTVSVVTGEVPIEQVIRRDGGFCATAAILGRTEFFKSEPDFLKECHLDLFIQCYLASCGKTLCIAEPLVAYRRDTEGSWSMRMKRNDGAYLNHKRSVINSFDKFDAFTNYEYHALIQDKIEEIEFSIYRLLGEYNKVRDEKFSKVIRKMNSRDRLKLTMEMYCPHILKAYQHLKRKK